MDKTDLDQRPSIQTPRASPDVIVGLSGAIVITNDLCLYIPQRVLPLKIALNPLITLRYTFSTPSIYLPQLWSPPHIDPKKHPQTPKNETPAPPHRARHHARLCFW